MTVAAKIEILGDGVDEDGQRHRRLKIGDKTLTVSLPDLVRNPKQLFAALANAGIVVVTAKAQGDILKAIEDGSCSEVTFQVFSRLGWSKVDGRYVFVRPDRIVGAKNDTQHEICLPFRADLTQKLRAAGSPAEWSQNIAKHCEGNSRLMFAVMLMIAGPFMEFMPKSIVRTGGFQFIGPKEQGKTTGLMVGGSVHGCHLGERAEKGYAEPWNSTPNEIEVISRAHAHHGMITDETSTMKADVYLEAAFRQAEGVEKSRLNQKRADGWCGFLLSSSNFSIVELSRQAGKRPNEALISRLFDVPLPVKGVGIFEDLKGFASGASLSAHLKEACQRSFGSVGLAVVEKLAEIVNSGGKSRLRKRLRKLRKRYLVAARREAQTRGVGIWLERPADRCATAYAAAVMASEYGLLSWSAKSEMSAVLSCHLDGLQAIERELGLPKAPLTDEPLRALEALRQYVADRGRDFLSVGKGLRRDHELGSESGYRARFREKKWVYFSPRQFRAIVGGRDQATALIRDIKANGLADAAEWANTAQRPFYRGRKGNKGHARVVAIRRKLFRKPDAPDL